MGVRTELDVQQINFVTGGETLGRDSETMAQIVGRSTDLAQFTLLYRNATTRKWGPLRTIDPALARGYMTCGALGCTEVELAAISDGEFSVDIDGETIDVTGCDFTVLDLQTDTPAKGVCGANGGNLAAYQAVTDGSYRVTVNGTQRDVTGHNFSGATAFADILNILNDKAAPYNLKWTYDETADVFDYFSTIEGDQSTLTVLSAAASGTDISGSGFLNGTSATLTQGAGGSGWEAQAASIIEVASGGKLECKFDGSAFTVYSLKPGYDSAVSVLSAVSGGSGTDISGASYLNGLTGTGTVTAGVVSSGEDLPAGIYMGEDIAAADIAAGDIEYCPILIGGSNVHIAEDLLVIENSLTLNSVIVSQAKTIKDYMSDALNIYTRDDAYLGNYEN